MTGRVVSHYEILEKLGEGGMGVLYKARDRHLDRLVALKILPADKVADPERRRRFVQEARAASALNHPHIVTVYDIDEADGVHFIAMEHVEGATLADRIGRRGLPLQDALKHAAQIADALAQAHAKGIVHRDLKPANVMVTPDGVTKVLDFGLAKLVETEVSEEETTDLKPATDEGMIVGTAAYMSPEQAQGRRVDARSDIFSFGSVLYEMVTGRRAFSGESNLDAGGDPQGGAATAERPRSRGAARAGAAHPALHAQGPRPPLPAHGRRADSPGAAPRGLRIGEAPRGGALVALFLLQAGSGRPCRRCPRARRRSLALAAPPNRPGTGCPPGGHTAHDLSGLTASTTCRRATGSTSSEPVRRAVGRRRMERWRISTSQRTGSRSYSPRSGGGAWG